MVKNTDIGPNSVFFSSGKITAGFKVDFDYCHYD